MGNTPNIRFKGFTEAWEQRKLGEISQITAGGTPSTKELTYWKPKEVPWLASGEVHKKYIYDTDEMISEEGLNNSSAKWVEEGSVLIALAGQGKTRGTAAITRIPITTNQSIAAIKFNDILDADYAFHNLDSRYDELRNISSGDGTRGGLNKQLLADLTITFPQICEQRAIGEYFTNLDHLITLHQQKCAEIKELKKYMLQNMFPQKDEKVPKIRFAGFTGDWKQRKLPEFVSFFNGLTYTPDDVEETGTLVLRSSNVKNGEIVDADNVYVNGKVVTSENVQKGDIIVVVRNGSRALIGKHAQIKASMPKTVIGAFMSGIRSEHSSFVNALLDTSAFENEIAKNMGATINQITGYMFSKMEFMIPSGEEQQQIGECFQRLDNLITLHQQKCAALKEFKKYMLQNMFPQKGENKCQN